MFGENEQFGQPVRAAFAEKRVDRAGLEGPWLPSLCLFITGPGCPVVTARCPRWAGDSGQQQMGGREELATRSIAAGVYFLKYLGAQMGIAWAYSCSPASPLLPVPPGHQVSADGGHLAALARSHLEYHLKACLLPGQPPRPHHRCHW